MTMTHLFFFTEAVLMQGVGLLNLGNTSKLDEPSSSLLFGSPCRPSYLSCKGTWEGGAVTEEMHPLHTPRHSLPYSRAPRALGAHCCHPVLAAE